MHCIPLLSSSSLVPRQSSLIPPACSSNRPICQITAVQVLYRTRHCMKASKCHFLVELQWCLITLRCSMHVPRHFHGGQTFSCYAASCIILYGICVPALTWLLCMASMPRDALPQSYHKYRTCSHYSWVYPWWTLLEPAVYRYIYVYPLYREVSIIQK